jgi:hypothetical protein
MTTHLLRPQPLKTVMGQRLTKREPLLDNKGVMYDDGTNHPLTLASNFPENVAKIMLENMKAGHSKKIWKFWIV